MRPLQLIMNFYPELHESLYSFFFLTGQPEICKSFWNVLFKVPKEHPRGPLI